MEKTSVKGRIIPVSLTLLRILIGWHFLYEGLIKILNPDWSARSFLYGSRWIFSGLFRWMASSETGIQIVNLANEYGLALIGLALILGLFTRIASWSGVLMLLMYYLAYPPFGSLGYGLAAEGSYLIVNKNLIELVALLIIAFSGTGEYLGLDRLIFSKKPVVLPQGKVPDPVQENDNGNTRRELIKSLAGIPSMPARPEGWDNLSDTEKNAWQQEAGKVREARKEWRIAAPMNKFEELRKIYNDAGVKIHILKFEPADWSDQELDYAFKVAKALGASGVSDEIGENSARRMGKFAEKHGMFAIFHQHEQPGQPGWSFDKFLAYSPANMLSFDAGHYFGATGLHPNGVIERLHKRIANVHIKDKTGPKSNPPDTNMPWGKGETPIADVLLLIRKNKWPINVDIELEYPVPEGSDAVKEVKKCVEYCKSILST